MDRLKAFAAVLPGLVVASISRWLDLFVSTRLAYPNWGIEAQEISLGVGALAATVICFVDADKSQNEVLSRARKLFVLTIVGIAACYCFYLLLGQGFVTAFAKLLQDLWFGCFILTMSLMIATLAEASL